MFRTENHQNEAAIKTERMKKKKKKKETKKKAISGRFRLRGFHTIRRNLKTQQRPVIFFSCGLGKLGQRNQLFS